MRVLEALTIRLYDIDFSVNPTKIHIERNLLRQGQPEIFTYQMKPLTILNNGLIGNIVIKAIIHPQIVVLTTT